MNDNVSYCGFDCGKCPVYQATISNNPEKIMEIMKVPVDKNLTIKEVGCEGCKSELRNHMCKTCYIRNCNEKRKIDSCAHCDSFPCEYISKNISKETMEYLKSIRK